MKVIFSSIKNSNIFENDFEHLSEDNGVIEFKHMRGAGGIAVVYAPNGTGKTSFAKLLEMEASEESRTFMAVNECGTVINPESESFHVIEEQM